MAAGRLPEALALAAVRRDVRALPGWRRFWEFEVVENAAFGTLCRIGRVRPRLIPALNRFSSAALSSRSYADLSHRVFVTPRRVRFAESEYAVPRESLGHVMAELRRAVPRLPDPVMFPVEVRVAAADDIWSGWPGCGAARVSGGGSAGADLSPSFPVTTCDEMLTRSAMAEPGPVGCP